MLTYSNQPTSSIYQTTFINNSDLEYLDFLALNNSSHSHNFLFYISRVMYKNQHVGLLVCYVANSLHSSTNSIKRIKRFSSPNPYSIQFINPSHLPNHLVKDFLSRFYLHPYPYNHSLGFQIQKNKCVKKNGPRNFFLILNQTDYGRRIYFIFCLHPFLKNHVKDQVKCQQLKRINVIADKPIESLSDVKKVQQFLLEKREVKLNSYIQSFSYAKENVKPLPSLLCSLPLHGQNEKKESCYIKNVNDTRKSTFFLANITVEEQSGNVRDVELVEKVQEWMMTFEERLQCFLKLCCVMQNVIIMWNEKSLQRSSFVHLKQWNISKEEISSSRLPMKKCLRKSLLRNQSTLCPNLLVCSNGEGKIPFKCLKSPMKFSLPPCVTEMDPLEKVFKDEKMKTDQTRRTVTKGQVLNSFQVGNMKSCEEPKKTINYITRPHKQYMQPTQASVNRTKLQLEQFIALQSVCDIKNAAYRKKLFS